jgi:hypothetical protein
MFAALLRRLTASGFRQGLTGSTPWLVIGILATGVRVIRRMSASEDDVLYRTVVRAGDVFEIVTRSFEQ